MECQVCFCKFTRHGRKCPKLLPCNDTICAACLQKLGPFVVDCPECDKDHIKPVHGFPTNQYMLKILDLEIEMDDLKAQLRRQSSELIASDLELRNLTTQLRSQSYELIATRIELKHTLQLIENPVVCNKHGKVCFKFCTNHKCFVPLCSNCALQEHDQHDFVSITKDIKDFVERQKRKQYRKHQF